MEFTIEPFEKLPRAGRSNPFEIGAEFGSYFFPKLRPIHNFCG